MKDGNMFHILYWDVNLDKQVKIGKLSYEQALHKKDTLVKRSHQNVQIVPSKK